MGKLEKEAKHIRHRGQVENAVLGAVAAGGVLALAAVAPNSVQLLKYIPGNTSKFSYQARTVAGRLVQKGMLAYEKREGRTYLRITNRGQEALSLHQERNDLLVRRTRRWDGRFRLVVFDIPESKRSLRNRLRATMRASGFLRLQNSVWVYPYECEELVILLKANIRLGREVLYAVVEKIENDRWLREHFKLPLQ